MSRTHLSLIAVALLAVCGVLAFRAYQPTIAASTVLLPASGGGTYVRVTVVAEQQTVDFNRVSESALSEVASSVLEQAKQGTTEMPLSATERGKLSKAVSRASFGYVDVTKLAIIRVMVGQVSPIAVVVGPANNSVVEVYCSERSGGSVDLYSGNCGEAIEETFGAPLLGEQVDG